MAAAAACVCQPIGCCAGSSWLQRLWQGNSALHAGQTYARRCAQAKVVADAALAFLAGFNRRTLDMIASRIYFYFSLAHERLDSLASIRRCTDGELAASVLQ